MKFFILLVLHNLCILSKGSSDNLIKFDSFKNRLNPKPDQAFVRKPSDITYLPSHPLDKLIDADHPFKAAM